MKNFYESNSDFREYVDRYSRNYYKGECIPVDEALQHAQVREAAKYYREKEIEDGQIKRD